MHSRLARSVTEVAVQFARIRANGKVDAWRTRSRTAWMRGDRVARIPIHAPSKNGVFAMRVVTRIKVGKRAGSGRTLTGPLGLPVASPATFTLVSCKRDSQDADIVEFFNYTNGNLQIFATVTDADSEFEVTLSCGDMVGVPSHFRFSIISSDLSLSTTCGQGPISIAKSSLNDDNFAFCTADSVCSFILKVDNSATGTVYGEENRSLPLVAGEQLFPVFTAAAPFCKAA